MVAMAHKVILDLVAVLEELSISSPVVLKDLQKFQLKVDQARKVAAAVAQVAV